MPGRPDIAALRERIAAEMEAKGFSRRSLSIAAGLSETTIRDVLTRTPNPGVGTLRKIADALSISLEDLNGGSGVPLVGRIGAGGLVAYFLDDQPQEYVVRPPLGTAALIALEVVGDSMLPKYEAGDIIYVRRDHEGVLPAYVDQYCAVHLSDGGTYLKILTRGTAGKFTLRSLNAADMVDTDVVWASPVLFVMPAIARRQLAAQSANKAA